MKIGDKEDNKSYLGSRIIRGFEDTNHREIRGNKTFEDQEVEEELNKYNLDKPKNYMEMTRYIYRELIKNLFDNVIQTHPFNYVDEVFLVKKNTDRERDDIEPVTGVGAPS